MSRIVPIFLLLLALAGPSVDGDDRYRLADLSLRVRLSDPQISPDGRSIVLTVSRPDAEANRWLRKLVAIDVGSGNERVLTRRGGARHARWSPSGDSLAFLARAEHGSQVHILPMAGGEALAITTAPAGVRTFTWSPDGATIAYVAADEAPPRDGHDTSFVVGSNHYLATESPVMSHVYLVGATGGEARQLTSELNLATSFGPAPLSFSPDGRHLAFVPTRGLHSGDADLTAVRVVEVESGEARAVTSADRFEGSARFTPDGTRIAYAYPRDGVAANLDEVYMAPAAGGQGRSATRELDRNVSLHGWLQDGTTMLLSGFDSTRRALWLHGSATRRLDLGEVVSFGGVTLGRSDEIAFIGSTSVRPAELYYMASPSSPPKRLTSFHDEIAGRQLGRTETITWQGPDGFEEDGVLVYPPDFEAAEKYPLVLAVHGGPTGTSTERFSDLPQLMAAEGWVVFQPNYRGSNHRGNAYQSAIADDCAEGPGRDVMAGIEAVKARGFIDAERVAVSGWSYGGWMTAWLIGRYPDAWRAAVAGAAPVDATDMTALSDLNVMIRHCLTSSPWVGTRYQEYLAQSPIAHFSKLRTPTLVMSKTGDRRVTVTGSYKLFHALRDNGVEVEFVAFPGAGHFPSDPAGTQDVYRRWIDWLKRHLDQ
ncbi:MAG: S9 family peptidase [bacterium]|nr:S9 family peptidase [bacterium]